MPKGFLRHSFAVGLLLSSISAFSYIPAAFAASCPSSASTTNEPVYYPQLEASYQASINTWEKSASANEGPGDNDSSLQGTEPYDSQYANLVMQHLQALGIDDVGTNFITSDYQTALATWQAETKIAAPTSWEEIQWYSTMQMEIANTYNQAIAASTAANGTVCPTIQSVVAPAPIVTPVAPPVSTSSIIATSTLPVATSTAATPVLAQPRPVKAIPTPVVLMPSEKQVTVTTSTSASTSPAVAMSETVPTSSIFTRILRALNPFSWFR